MADGEIPSHLRFEFAELWATVSANGRLDNDPFGGEHSDELVREDQEGGRTYW